MTTKSLLLWSCFLFAIPLFSQKKHTISGYLKDATNGETLISGTIYSANLTIGTTSNVYGFYSLSLPEGEHDLTFSYVGYENKVIKINLKRDTTINAELSFESYALEAVEISAVEELTQTTEISTVTMSAKQIKEIPSIGEPDIQQAILSQAGVSTVSEGSTGYNVRGGKTDQNLTIIDEAPLFNSSHLFGFVTVVNTSAVKNLTFYKSGIPAKYGGRASSIMDIQFKEGNSKKFAGDASINPVVSKLGLEIPIIPDKMTVLFSGRYAFVGLLMPLIVPDQKLYFYDATLKWTYNINEKNKVYLSGYLGRDRLLTSYDEYNNVTKMKENKKSDINWGDRLLSFRWNHVFSHKLFANLTLLTGNYDFSYETNSNLLGVGKVGGTLNMVNSIKTLSGKLDFYYNPLQTLEVNFGFGATNNQFELLNIDDGSVKEADKPIKNAFEYWGYADIEPTIGDKLKLRLGLRMSAWVNYGADSVKVYKDNEIYSPLNVKEIKSYKDGEAIKDYLNFEPRLSLNYAITDNVSLKLAYDRLVQYAHLMTNSYGIVPYDSWIPSSTYVKPILTDQYSGGFVFDILDLNFDVTYYYKLMQNVLEFKKNSDLLFLKDVETEMVPAEGKSYGIEVNISKDFGKLTTMANYTFSQSTIRTTSDLEELKINNNEWYTANYDRPHNLNLIGSYEFNQMFKLSSKFVLQSGRPVTIPQSKVGDVVIYSDRNDYRLPMNHRWDLSLEYNPKKNQTDRRIKQQWVFSVINVYGRKNAFNYIVQAKNILNQSTGVYDQNYNFKQISIIGAAIPTFSYNLTF